MPAKSTKDDDNDNSKDTPQKGETRLYQVTNYGEGGKVVGTEKKQLTKKQALDAGFPWT